MVPLADPTQRNNRDPKQWPVRHYNGPGRGNDWSRQWSQRLGTRTLNYAYRVDREPEATSGKCVRTYPSHSVNHRSLSTSQVKRGSHRVPSASSCPKHRRPSTILVGCPKTQMKWTFGMRSLGSFKNAAETTSLYIRKELT